MSPAIVLPRGAWSLPAKKGMKTNYGNEDSNAEYKRKTAHKTFTWISFVKHFHATPKCINSAVTYFSYPLFQQQIRRRKRQKVLWTKSAHVTWLSHEAAAITANFEMSYGNGYYLPINCKTNRFLWNLFHESSIQEMSKLDLCEKNFSTLYIFYILLTEDLFEAF